MMSGHFFWDSSVIILNIRRVFSSVVALVTVVHEVVLEISWVISFFGLGRIISTTESTRLL